jgi:hypothetical protein
MAENENNSWRKKFDPESAFFDLPIVRKTFWFGLILVTGLMIVIAVIDFREPNWSAAGFNELLVMFRLPLSLLAFFAAVFALYATNHRSEQNKRAMALTTASIEATGAQNRFANYYKHLDEFTKYVDTQISLKGKLINVNPRLLHQAWYPAARNTIAFSAEVKRAFMSNLLKGSTYLYEFDDKTPLGFVSFVVVIDGLIQELNSKLGYQFEWSQKARGHKTVIIDERPYSVPDGQIGAYWDLYIDRVENIFALMLFDPQEKFIGINELIMIMKQLGRMIPETYVNEGRILMQTPKQAVDFRKHVQELTVHLGNLREELTKPSV